VLGGDVHIHVGPSPLGLGLPVAVSLGVAGLETHIVGKPYCRHPNYFSRTVYYRSGSQTVESRIPVASFTSANEDVIPPEIASAVSGAAFVLITVSLRDAVADRAGLILRVIDQIPLSAEVVFIACENTLTDAHKSLIEALPSRVRHLRCVVDRVCTWEARADSQRRPPEPRHVVYHEVGEWVIEQPASASKLTRLLGSSPEVRFVAACDLHQYEARKAWFVNGMHTDFAIRGRAANQPDLRLVANDPELLGMLQATIDTMQIALELRHGMHVPSDWALDRLRVVSQLPDSCDRILESLTRADPGAFLTSFEKRIGEPARLASSVRPIPASLESLAYDLSEILQDGEQYSDWHALESHELTEDRDAAAVSAFRHAMKGWMPAAFVGREARRLERSLLSQRRNRLAVRPTSFGAKR
jgi:hypothetical protein